MDYHMDNTLYRSPWNAFPPRVPAHSAQSSRTQHMNVYCVRDFRRNTNIRTTTYISALSRAKKQRRDRARMAAFILRKTAENLPFGSLDDEDLRKLGTNTSLCGVTPTVSVSTQTEEQAEVNALKVENESLRQRASECKSLKAENISLHLKVNNFDTLFQERNELYLQKTQLEVDVTKLEKERSDVIASNIDIKVALTDSEHKLTEARSLIKDLHNMLECLQSQLETELTDNRCLQEMLRRANTYNVELEGNVKNYKRQLAEAHSSIANLQKMMDTQPPGTVQTACVQSDRAYNRNHRGHRYRRGR